MSAIRHHDKVVRDVQTDVFFNSTLDLHDRLDQYPQGVLE